MLAIPFRVKFQIGASFRIELGLAASPASDDGTCATPLTPPESDVRDQVAEQEVEVRKRRGDGRCQVS